MVMMMMDDDDGDGDGDGDGDDNGDDEDDDDDASPGWFPPHTCPSSFRIFFLILALFFTGFGTFGLFSKLP